MQYTENFNLNLPEATDVYDIENENQNMQTIDSALYSHGILLGTPAVAGHNKIIDGLNKTAFANGEALSAHMGNALGEMLAPIEPGPNYSRSYSKGAQFVYNGRLCVVTATSVSSSTAINIGSSGNANYASPITSQISDVVTPSSINITMRSGFIRTGIARRLGKLCVISGRFISTTEISKSATAIADITSEYFPVDEAYGSIITLTSTGQTGVAYITTTSNGEIKIQLNEALPANKPFYFTLIWMIAN